MGKQALIDYIRTSVIGDDKQIQTAFGSRPLLYCDYTASGRSLSFIEEFIREQVLPYYANTHTETSFTGAQTTAFREQARDLIKKAVNADDSYSVIFCGTGATGAIDKLIDLLGLRFPNTADDEQKHYQFARKEDRPVIFIGPYEHHSNELPWRESIAEVVSIPLDDDGQIDIAALEAALDQYQARRLKIGSFSAASNVTGIKSDIRGISTLLKRYGALSFWDYAAAAPYCKIDMRGLVEGESKDAVFISPHKFIGGPGTPGILVINNAILTNRVPAVCGGGTVLYVTPQDHIYLDKPERREEAGTPGIVESIRAGLVFQLQQAVGIEEIEKREQDMITTAISRLRDNANIRILGNLDAKRLGILSFQIKSCRRILHYGYVVALLNDLFGIQARGGCSCAGPYAHSLLDMDMDYSKLLEEEIVKGNSIMRPGWVRLSFNYFISEESFLYILRAIELIAEHGWRLLASYEYDKESGIWSYHGNKMALKLSLTDISYDSGRMSLADTLSTAQSRHLDEYLKQAEDILRKEKQTKRKSISLPKSAETLRWFTVAQDLVKEEQLKQA